MRPTYSPARIWPTNGGSLIWRIPYKLYASVNTVQAASAGNLQCYPFRTQAAFTVTGMAMNVTGSPTGNKLLRFGIYAVTSDGITPNALLVDCGELSIAATGVKAVTGLSVRLKSNSLYHCAWLADYTGTCTFKAVAYSNFAGGILGATDAALGDYYYERTATAYAYGALPNPHPAVTWSVGSSAWNPPAIWIAGSHE